MSEFCFLYCGKAFSKSDGTWVADGFSYRHREDGVSVHVDRRALPGFDADDWLLRFENVGDADSGIVEDVQVLDTTLPAPAEEEVRLFSLNGAPANQTDFAPALKLIAPGQSLTLSARGGRSSNGDFPFFRIDTAEAAHFFAVGWSGQWKATLQRGDDGSLRIRAGMERTHFRLHPGESVRMPRILWLRWTGDRREAWSAFRRLIREHYAARRGGQPAPATVFCNTCFTRGGAWLNECDQQNQASLVAAMGDLGVEAVVTDAGWFPGGWPEGAGNWDSGMDPEKYPDGPEAIARVAKAHGTVWGLWFEPERAGAGCKLAADHPDWVLPGFVDRLEAGFAPGGLVNFGLPVVREFFLKITRGYLAIDGFDVYRQDFNTDPLPFWQAADAEDRVGITEIRYIEGLYDFWDRLIADRPNTVFESCASGGRRIDLEVIQRFGLNQKSDHWFDNVTDATSLLALSHFLPTSLLAVPICRLDGESFRASALASWVLGWIADEPDFNTARARELLKAYDGVREILQGDFYPLTDWPEPYVRDNAFVAPGPGWMAGQVHDPETGKGVLYAQRRQPETSNSLTVAPLHLNVDARYRLRDLPDGPTREAAGAELAAGWGIEILDAPGTVMTLYEPIV